MKEVASNWFLEFVTPDFIQQFSIKGILYSGRSKYQSIEIIDTSSFGKCLVLDGKIQSSEKDEFIYHEALVHPAMLLHPCPKTVFIAGGGEGATLRETLAHNTVEKVVMVDIDKEVIDICRQFLPSLHQGSFQDSRLKLYHLDARKYLAETDEKFHVVIIDLPEPLAEGPAYLLYTQEFYQLVKDRLTEDGVICLQAGTTCLGLTAGFTAINNTLKTVFPVVTPYEANIPSFGGTWGFSLAAKKYDPLELPPQEVEKRLSARVRKTLRFYDGHTHQGLFFIPKYLREAVANETRVITEQEPLFI
jgi:spermidine synthase